MDVYWIAYIFSCCFFFRALLFRFKFDPVIVHDIFSEKSNLINLINSKCTNTNYYGG